jgi:hypothetical protein
VAQVIELLPTKCKAPVLPKKKKSLWEAMCRRHANTTPFYIRDLYISRL